MLPDVLIKKQHLGCKKRHFESRHIFLTLQEGDTPICQLKKSQIINLSNNNCQITKCQTKPEYSFSLEVEVCETAIYLVALNSTTFFCCYQEGWRKLSKQVFKPVHCSKKITWNPKNELWLKKSVKKFLKKLNSTEYATYYALWA